MFFNKIVFKALYIVCFIGPIKALRINYYVRINSFPYVRGEKKHKTIPFAVHRKITKFRSPGFNQIFLYELK